MGMYDGMLPVKQKDGYRGYYPVTNKEEWDELPDLYKAMEWSPIPDPFDKNHKLRAVKNVIFDVVYMEPYGIKAEVSVHPQEIQKILFCHYKKKDCQLYTICGIELEGGSRLPAKWLQDPTTGAFEIVSHGKRVATQGGYFGFIPKHIQVLKDGSFKYDFKYNEGPVTHYTLLNPFRTEPVKEIKIDTTKQLMDAIAAYGLENNWNDSEIIDTLVECGVTHDDFKKYGKEDFVKDYFKEDLSANYESVNGIENLKETEINNPIMQSLLLKKKGVILNAEAAAMETGYDQFVITDAKGEYSFAMAAGGRPVTPLFPDETIVGKVTHRMVQGVPIVKYEDVKSLDEKIEYSNDLKTTRKELFRGEPEKADNPTLIGNKKEKQETHKDFGR